MRRDVEMHDPPSVVRQHQQHVQGLKADRGHGEEVHGDHGLDVILQEGPPGLRRWLPASRHVLAHTSLADVDAEFEQFTVAAWRSPQWVLAAHLADQFSDMFRDFRSSRLPASSFPSPEQAEALAVPSNHSLRFDDDQRRTPVAPNSGQPRPQQPVRRGQLGTFHRTLQNGELMPECQHLDLKSCSTPDAIPCSLHHSGQRIRWEQEAKEAQLSIYQVDPNLRERVWLGSPSTAPTSGTFGIVNAEQSAPRRV